MIFPEDDYMDGSAALNKILKTILLIFAGLLAAVILVAVLWLGRQWNRTTYFEKTMINNIDASGKTPDEMMPLLEKAYTSSHVRLMEGDKTENDWALSDIGYTLDKTKLKAGLEDAAGRQKSSIAVLLDSLLNGNRFTVEVPFVYDADKFAAAVTAANMADARVENVDATLAYDDAAKNYSITPEVQGTKLQDADLQNLVKSAVDKAVSVHRLTKDLTISVPSDIYIKPNVLSTDTDLNDQMNAYNSFDKAKITYLYGDQSETIDWNTIKDWVFIEDHQGMLSEEKLREYVTTIGQKYNTKYYQRDFQTSLGTTVTIPENMNEYGYLVDEEGEYQQLLSDIQSNTEVQREPVYSDAGIGRSGQNDLSAGYVEVNITQQHLWFYKNGQLVVESGVVTGCVAKKNETQTGVYPIAYKESPATLIPSNETNGTPVQYWMPFYDGQGLHDASWRTDFGGQIYQTNGSHGCVNLPPDVAKTIFENADTGTPVILYK